MKGKLYALEGLDGCGKTYIAKRVGELLSREGYKVIVTQEPSGTKLGEIIKKQLLETPETSFDTLTELFLYEAARRDHYLKVIKPALEAGKIVICDRFVDSSLVYQGYLGNISIDAINNMTTLAIENCYPSRSMYIRVKKAKTAVERINKNQRKTDKNDNLPLLLHQQIKKGYDLLYQPNQENPSRVVIDGDKSKNEVVLDVVSCILCDIEMPEVSKAEKKKVDIKDVS